MAAFPDSVALGPEWLAHRYDEQNEAVQFVRADRPLRRSVPFLIDEHLPGAKTPLVLGRRDALAQATRPAPVHFIFHSAFCCSTLLVRALDVKGRASGLSEPQILNDMVGWRHRGAKPAQVGEMLHNSLALLARPFEAGEACVIKPSNIVNGLAEGMLKLRPEARAVLVHAPLRAFVTSIARKGMWGRLWVRELLSKQLTDGIVQLGFEPRDHLLQTDLQAAAVAWLAQHKLFAILASRWPERVRTLDSETLIARPAESLDACSDLFGLGLDDDEIASVVAEVFSRNTKDGSVFEPGQRESERKAGEALHGDEIDKVSIWAEAVAEAAGVEMGLPSPLL